MFLSRIRIANFKSLKDVEINSEGLVALVGPNGSGKTNFALAMKFLSEVHQHGLEMAISRAGGFENIAYRKGKRTTAPIEFEVEVRFDPEQTHTEHLFGLFELFPQLLAIDIEGSFTLRHEFGFKAAAGGLRAEYVVDREQFQLEVSSSSGIVGSRKDFRGYLCMFTRGSDGNVEVQAEAKLKRVSKKRRLYEANLGEQQLLIEHPYFRSQFQDSLSSFFVNLGVYHFSSDKLREPGVPTPNPALAMLGENLPTMVDWLQKKQPKVWRDILDAMQIVVPELRDITVYPLASKTYGLLFKEEGVKLPWRIDEVSDGTLHALSMLVAAADPRTSALVIEEPESSLHPWIIHELAKKLRELSEEKSIFLTTQSLVVIESLRPSEVWIVSRRKGKTEIRRLTELDKRVEKDWSEGKYGLSEFLDSGLIPRAVPGGRT